MNTLGRNALNMSYVTGYDDVFSQNQHSRMYSAQLDGRLPHPPVGTIAAARTQTFRAGWRSSC